MTVRDLCAAMGKIFSAVFVFVILRYYVPKLTTISELFSCADTWQFFDQMLHIITAWDYLSILVMLDCVLANLQHVKVQKFTVSAFLVSFSSQPGYNTAAKVLKLCTNFLVYNLINHTNFQPVWLFEFFLLEEHTHTSSKFLIFSILHGFNYLLQWLPAGMELTEIPHCWDPNSWE